SDLERLNSELAGRPGLGTGSKTLTFYPGQVGMPPDASPRILNRSWSVQADIEVPATGVDGMIVTQGGLEGGYGLYVRGGKPTFVYNYLSIERATVAGSAPLPSRKGMILLGGGSHGGPEEGGKPTTLPPSANRTH